VAAEAGNGEDGLRLIVELSPLIAILDAHMPKMSGREVTPGAMPGRGPLGNDRARLAPPLPTSYYWWRPGFQVEIDHGIQSVERS